MLLHRSAIFGDRPSRLIEFNRALAIEGIEIAVTLIDDRIAREWILHQIGGVQLSEVGWERLVLQAVPADEGMDAEQSQFLLCRVVLVHQRLYIRSDGTEEPVARRSGFVFHERFTLCDRQAQVK